jgi:hypothetical protein
MVWRTASSNSEPRPSLADRAKCSVQQVSKCEKKCLSLSTSAGPLAKWATSKMSAMSPKANRKELGGCMWSQLTPCSAYYFSVSYGQLLLLNNPRNVISEVKLNRKSIASQARASYLLVGVHVGQRGRHLPRLITVSYQIRNKQKSQLLRACCASLYLARGSWRWLAHPS